MVNLGKFRTNDRELLNELSAFVPDAPTAQKKDRVDALVHCLHMVQMYAPTRFEVKTNEYAGLNNEEYWQKASREIIKRSFKQSIGSSESDGVEIYNSDGSNRSDHNYY